MTENNAKQTLEKVEYQAQLLKNRIEKNRKNLRKWSRKNKITCYRLYDKDIPEIPLAIDIYTTLSDEIQTKIDSIKYLEKLDDLISQNSNEVQQYLEEEKSRTYARVYLYERNYEKDEDEENFWLEKMCEAISASLEIPADNVISKLRRKQRDVNTNSRKQYTKDENKDSVYKLTQEQGQLFRINLSDYIDTGLFLDHRNLRKHIRETSSSKNVLNLFCYTGSFSVYAAEGNCKSVESVDLSNTYLDWAKQNMLLNEFYDENKYTYVRSDVETYLDTLIKNNSRKFDIIILDPPTFSNSKKMDKTLDINRDWKNLVEKCLQLLSQNGILYFSTNSKTLCMNEKEINMDKKFSVTDITPQTISQDFRNTKIHKAWKFELL